MKYPVVSNRELSIDVDAPTVTTMVYQDPVTRQREEGLAVLREPDKSHCDDEWWTGRIEFTDEPGQYYSRQIYRK